MRRPFFALARTSSSLRVSVRLRPGIDSRTARPNFASSGRGLAGLCQSPVSKRSRFEPPLAPAVQTCAAKTIYRLTLEERGAVAFAVRRRPPRWPFQGEFLQLRAPFAIGQMRERVAVEV